MNFLVDFVLASGIIVFLDAWVQFTGFDQDSE